MTGSTEWQRSGKEEHAAGETEYKAAQAQGYAEGTKDRVAGKKDAVVGAVTGDRSQEASGKSTLDSSFPSHTDIYPGNVRHDKGEAQQEVNKH